MQKVGQDVPLPEEMQGKWVDSDEPTAELVISGNKIICFGVPVAHDYKVVIRHEDGVLTVNLKINDPKDEDAFQRANITGLALTPGGDLYAYNVKFASKFVRSGD